MTSGRFHGRLEAHYFCKRKRDPYEVVSKNGLACAGTVAAGPERLRPKDGGASPVGGFWELASSQKGSNEEKSEPSGLEEIESEPAVPVGLVGKGESVADEWFADAVFLGNSLTDGLELYSGIKNASFISHQGLSVFNIASKE